MSVNRILFSSTVWVFQATYWYISKNYNIKAGLQRPLWSCHNMTSMHGEHPSKKHSIKLATVTLYGIPTKKTKKTLPKTGYYHAAWWHQQTHHTLTCGDDDRTLYHCRLQQFMADSGSLLLSRSLSVIVASLYTQAGKSFSQKPLHAFHKSVQYKI